MISLSAAPPEQLALLSPGTICSVLWSIKKNNSCWKKSIHFTHHQWTKVWYFNWVKSVWNIKTCLLIFCAFPVRQGVIYYSLYFDWVYPRNNSQNIPPLPSLALMDGHTGKKRKEHWLSEHTIHRLHFLQISTVNIPGGHKYSSWYYIIQNLSYCCLYWTACWETITDSVCLNRENCKLALVTEAACCG